MLENVIISSNLPVDIRITNTKIWNAARVKFVRVNLEGKLNFDYRVNSPLKRQVKSTTLMREYIIYVLMNAFMISQFSYCPLVWMFHSRTLRNRINKLHEKALRLVYKNKIFLFWWLTKKGQINEHSPKESTNTCDRDLQWNIYKADAIGAKRCFRFIEMSAL